MKKLLYALGIISLVLSSCTKIIDIELNDEDSQRLVVDGWFTTETRAHEINLTLTTSYFHNETAPRATGATVYVTDGTNQIAFSESDPGVYVSPITAGEFNTTYTLHIEYGGEVYESTAYIDSISPLDSLACEPWYNLQGEHEGYDVNIWAQEMPGKGDHYLWRLHHNGVLVSDTLNEIYFDNDEYLPDGLYFANWNIEWVDGQPGDQVRLEQHRISGETYDMMMAMMLETEWKGSIFDAPPANVPSNISNGALGFFIASAEVSNTCVIQ